jgi:hypothetical protein
MLLLPISNSSGCAPTAEIMRCGTCGFGFVSPWASGDGEFYRLVHQAELTTRITGGSSSKPSTLSSTAAMVGSLADGADHGPFDAICMFQTVEHLADLDRLYATLRGAITRIGSIFISVPNGESIAVQERLTGFLDMPPNHVGRWTARAFDAAAGRSGLRVADQRTEPLSVLGVAWLLARYKLSARAYTKGTVAHRVNAIRARPIRGAAKLALAAGYVPQMLKQRDQFLPQVRWVHLKRV